MTSNGGTELPETAAFITGLIVERPLCLDCLAAKTALTATIIEDSLAMIGTAMSVKRNSTLCRSCGETKATVSLRRPDAA
jgi:hypothetical protein